MNTTRGTVEEMIASVTLASVLVSAISDDSQTKYSSAVRLWSVAMRQVDRKRAPSQMENTVLVLPQSIARSMGRSGFLAEAPGVSHPRTPVGYFGQNEGQGQKNTSAAGMARVAAPCRRIRLPSPSTVSKMPSRVSVPVRAVMR